MQTANQRSDHCQANLQQMEIRGQADSRSELLERDTTQDVQEQVVMYLYSDMAVASGPAGPVLAGPVFMAIFETAHAQIMNNKQHVWGPSYNLSLTHAYTRVYATRTFCDGL